MADLVDVKLIDGTARNIRELFTGRKYGVDYYQREYSWTESNVTALIDDLGNSFKQDYARMMSVGMLPRTGHTSSARSLRAPPAEHDISWMVSSGSRRYLCS